MDMASQMASDMRTAQGRSQLKHSNKKIELNMMDRAYQKKLD